MKSKIEILVIDVCGQLIGMDCSEIKKIISDAALVEMHSPLTISTNENKFYKIGEIFNTGCDVEYNSLITINIEDKEDVLVLCPTITEILSTEISSILPVPDFIKKKQDPFFVWGFLINETQLITLITFSFFKVINEG